MLYEHAEWWSKKGWFVLYIKWKQTFAISPMTWGLYHLQGEEDHEARNGGALRRDISSIFWNVTGEYPVSRGRVAWRFGDRNKSHPSFVGKLRHFLEKLRQVQVQVDEAPEAFDHPTTSWRVRELRWICSTIDCVGWNHLPRLRPFLLRRTKEHQWNLVVYLMSYIIVI